MPIDFFYPAPSSPDDEHPPVRYAPVAPDHIRVWGPDGRPKDFKIGEGLSTYDFEGIRPERLARDEDLESDMPDTSEPYEYPENMTRRGLFVYAAGAAATAATLGGAVMGVRKVVKEVNEHFERDPFCRHTVESGETLTTITEKLYPHKINDREWISSFVTRSITNTTKDDRRRDENTIYPGDVLEITLDPNEEATLNSCELAE